MCGSKRKRFSLWSEDPEGYSINKFTLACKDREANQAIKDYNLERINRYADAIAVFEIVSMLSFLAEIALTGGIADKFLLS